MQIKGNMSLLLLSKHTKFGNDAIHAAEAACQTTTVTDVTVIQDGDLSILA